MSAAPMSEDEAAEVMARLVSEGHLDYYCSCACNLTDHLPWALRERLDAALEAIGHTPSA